MVSSNRKNSTAVILEQKVKEILADVEADAVSQGMVNASIIARRAAIAGCRFNVLRDVSRLMPHAARAILDIASSGSDIESGTVWWAPSLAAPRGRMERRWWAPEGGIYFCIAIFPELVRRCWPLYSIAMGMAVAESMNAHGMQAKVRWINDVLLNGRKISGSLAESIYISASGETWLLLGTGINVNIRQFPPYLDQAGSLLIETGRTWPLEDLGADIIARFGWNTGLLHQWDVENLGGDLRDSRDINPLISRWRQLSDSVGRKIIFGRDLEQEEGERGDSLDITEEGRLIIQNDRGEIVELDAGEIRYV